MRPGRPAMSGTTAWVIATKASTVIAKVRRTLWAFCSSTGRKAAAAAFAHELAAILVGEGARVGLFMTNHPGSSEITDTINRVGNVVLLDGVRIVPSGLVGRVDLNNIPLALVERVDTLTGGAGDEDEHRANIARTCERLAI